MCVKSGTCNFRGREIAFFLVLFLRPGASLPLSFPFTSRVFILYHLLLAAAAVVA